MNQLLNNIKGYLFAALAAAAYGTNPVFAIPLYSHGMNPNSVLIFRYLLGLPILVAIMLIRGMSFRLKRQEILQIFILGCLMALSSLTLFESYNYINSGIASTLLFVYPVMVAVLMIFFFHEKLKMSILICLIIMAAGIYFLMKPQNGIALDKYGCLLVMMSALTYSLYIVMVNVSKSIKTVPTTKLLFYVLLFGSFVFIFMFLIGSELTLPEIGTDWINLVALALIPTVISLAFTTMAIHLIGSTPTAILGALEPVTALILSVLVLNQTISPRDLMGCGLIVVATTIVVCSHQVDHLILHIRKMFPKHLLR